ncbi:MAG: KamA family radical SAM protein [Desulfobacterales bacterium]|nr:KamA family radical SAM protein [Desulfobacterales bacterium]MBF0395617.1 KamA family radical SAM protein [Desulfobacterales bacterium]
MLNELILDNEDEPPGSRPPLNGGFKNGITFNFKRLNLFEKTTNRTKRRQKNCLKTRTFRRNFFPNIADKEWNDWRWQISNRIRTPSQLKHFLSLSEQEENAINFLNAKLPIGITPYYMSLIDHVNSSQPLRRTVIPTIDEFFKMPGESDDPLSEEAQSPVPGLVHRYPDRVLLLVLDFCSTYCRYCTRSRVVGHGALHATRSRLEQAFEYIRRTPTIRDVLISGGDPLTLNDDRLNWVLTNLRSIPHVEIIRIGTKIPAVLPQRVTPQLVRMLKRHHPLFMSLHFTHPEECTEESYKACERLSDGGIPLGSQTVLLKGINDNVETMKELMHNMLMMRVRPYYLYQCDPISGSHHFRTSVEKGLEIIQGLRGFTSGYAIPTYVIDAPGGGGKIPLMPDYVMSHKNQEVILKNYENKIFSYPDVICQEIVM